MNNEAVIIGGGLWGGLLAYRWQMLYPDVPFQLLEKEATFGGNHTWSFHDEDLPKESREWVSAFIEKSWEGYEVKFPEFTRRVPLCYHSVTSERFHKVLTDNLPKDRLQLRSVVGPEALLKDSTFIIDARGSYEIKETGWQKFLGLEVILEKPHGLSEPVLMDCLIPQTDGFRFFYLLPFDERRMLVELTSYSNESVIPEVEYEASVMKFISEKGWVVKEVRRVEKASLPIPLSEIEAPLHPHSLCVGGIFHDTTGYSLPDAVRLIERLLRERPSPSTFERVLSAYRKERKTDRSFFRLLNRFMFRASSNEERYRMLQFFYKHQTNLISRFYEGRMSHLDRARFFMGKPPVSITRAVKELLR